MYLSVRFLTKPSVLQEEVGCYVDVIVGGSEGLQGIRSGEAHFHQPGNLGQTQQQIRRRIFTTYPKSITLSL